ncbi:MAG: transporter, partial [Bdellovibrionales bacterium]|nr:transporter [Bdellovibrionales bacterium]
LSALFDMSIPVGDSDLSHDEFGFEFRLAWAYELQGPFALGGNLIYSNYEGQTERVSEFGFSIAPSIHMSDAASIYFEYFGLYPESNVPEEDQHFMGTGFTYLVNDNMQLDARVGTGLNDASEDLFTGAGVVFRM